MSNRRDFLKLLGMSGIAVTVGQPELFHATAPAVPGVAKPRRL